MRSLMCGILKLKQTSDYNNKNRLIGTENKLVVSMGRGKVEGQDGGGD